MNRIIITYDEFLHRCPEARIFIQNELDQAELECRRMRKDYKSAPYDSIWYHQFTHNPNDVLKLIERLEDIANPPKYIQLSEDEFKYFGKC